MKANGSPPPVFQTDEGRRECMVRLPAHPLALLSTPEATMEVTMEVAMEVRSIVKALTTESTRQELQQTLGLKNNDHFRKAYLLPAIDAGLVQMTVPDKPRSSNQRYRLTAAGRLWLVKNGSGKRN